jgi:hypothetical protein
LERKVIEAQQQLHAASVATMISTHDPAMFHSEH